jgi:uncharacterized spore protein YtfJ
MDVYGSLGSLAESLRESATIEKVYGEPIEAYGKTIIPTARIAYGLGRGFGKEKTHDEEGRKEERPAGESGGGGITVAPLGVFEVSQENTRFVPLRHGRKAGWAGGFITGAILGMLLSSVRRTH